MKEAYYEQKVEITIPRNSAVFSRLEKLAEKTGEPIDVVFSWAVLLGIEKHLEDTVRVLEKIHE
jgi:hypothetical protein